MAAMNSSVLACSYAISGAGSSELSQSSKLVSLPATALNMPLIRAQNVKASDSSEQRNDGSQGRRAALLCLGAALFATATSSANAGPIEDALERSKLNKVYFGLLCICSFQFLQIVSCVVLLSLNLYFMKFVYVVISGLE